MFAIVRQFAYDPTELAKTQRALDEVASRHASQAGYAGSLLIDDGGRLTVVNLWDSEEAAAAGRAAIGPDVQRLLEPLMSGSSEVVAAGEVLASEGLRRPR